MLKTLQTFVDVASDENMVTDCRAEHLPKEAAPVKTADFSR